MAKIQKSYKPQGLAGSFIIHGLLLLLFFFFVLRTPDPPLNLGGSGIELNYGTVEEGFGDNQTLEPNGTNEQPLPSPAEIPEPKPVEQVPAPVEPQPSSAEDVITSNEEEAPKLTAQPKKEIQNPEKTKEKIKVEKEKIEVVKNRVTETNEATKTIAPPNPATSNAAGGGNNNNGDKPGKVGDQGNPNGSVDAKALYGNLGEGGPGNGGTGGNRLDLTGWKLDFKLDKKDVTSENGKIVFQIKVDDKGDLVSIVPIEKTVSPAVVKFYQDEIVENWAVDRSKENVNPPPLATGRYTVFVRSK